MATFVNQSKSSASSYSGLTKSSTSFGLINQIKGGLGWLYNQAGITYNGTTDPISGNVVYYNGLGTVATWANQSEI